jgi:nitroreductase
MELHEALTTTRSVRRRLDETRPVPRETLLDCVALASQAPTGGGRQRLRWVFVDDPATRIAVVEAFRDRGLAQFEALRERAVGTPGANIYQSAIDLLLRMERIPVLAFPCMTGPAPEPMENWTAASYYGSAIPAIWSFQLGLRARGLGSVYTTVHLQREREVAEIIGIPEGVRQMALLPIAYTSGDGFKPAARRDPEEVTSFNRFEARS